MLTRLSGLLPLLCAFAATATPHVRDKPPATVAVTRKLNFTGGSTFVEMDRARAQSLFSHKPTGSRDYKRNVARAPFTHPATSCVVGYTMTVGVGSPPTNYTLILDSGSSNTWVGASKPYVFTSTSVNMSQPVSVTYGSGSFSGTEFNDTITLAPGLAIAQQSIGVASTSTGFTGVDGILGLGPEDLTKDTLTNEPNTLIPTVIQNAYTQSLISAEEIGIAFAPITSVSDMNGVITFGGIDSSYYTGEIAYVPTVTSGGASSYVGITQSVSYGSIPLFDGMSGIVDTGTTLLYIPTPAYYTYQFATGGVEDSATGFLRITPSQYGNLQNMTFTIGDTAYTFTPDAQIWPRSLNTFIGGSNEYIYLIACDIGQIGEGLNGPEFVNGMIWLERYYFAYNSGSDQVGFATTQNTYATTNYDA